MNLSGHRTLSPQQKLDALRGCGRALAQLEAVAIRDWASQHSGLRDLAEELFLYPQEATTEQAIRILLSDGPDDVHGVVVGAVCHADTAGGIVRALNRIPANLRGVHRDPILRAAEAFIAAELPFQRAACRANKSDMRVWMQRCRRKHAGYRAWYDQALK